MAKYLVMCIGDPFGELEEDVYKNKPEAAIHQWCIFQNKYPACAEIKPQSEADGVKLLQWAEQNFKKVEKWMNDYDVPYKIEWVKEAIAKELQKNQNGKAIMQWAYDAVHPFSFG